MFFISISMYTSNSPPYSKRRVIEPEHTSRGVFNCKQRVDIFRLYLMCSESEGSKRIQQECFGRHTLAFANSPTPSPRSTRLSRRWTLVRTILSSSRLSSVRKVSIRASAYMYCWYSSCAFRFCRSEDRVKDRKDETHKPTSQGYGSEIFVFHPFWV